jgi:hypothetical protein
VVDDMGIKEMEKACRKVEVASTPLRKFLRTVGATGFSGIMARN